MTELPGDLPVEESTDHPKAARTEAPTLQHMDVDRDATAGDTPAGCVVDVNVRDDWDNDGTRDAWVDYVNSTEDQLEYGTAVVPALDSTCAIQGALYVPSAEVNGIISELN